MNKALKIVAVLGGGAASLGLIYVGVKHQPNAQDKADAACMNRQFKDAGLTNLHTAALRRAYVAVAGNASAKMRIMMTLADNRLTGDVLDPHTGRSIAAPTPAGDAAVKAMRAAIVKNCQPQLAAN